MEKLQGMDVLTFLSQRHEYTEQMVASIITQVTHSNIFIQFPDYTKTDNYFQNFYIDIGWSTVPSLAWHVTFGPAAGQCAADICS